MSECCYWKEFVCGWVCTALWVDNGFCYWRERYGGRREAVCGWGWNIETGLKERELWRGDTPWERERERERERESDRVGNYLWTVYVFVAGDQEGWSEDREKRFLPLATCPHFSHKHFVCILLQATLLLAQDKVIISYKINLKKDVIKVAKRLTNINLGRPQF